VAELYQGAVGPETYAFSVTPGDTGLDLSTVTAASFRVLKPNATTITTWSATLSNQTATTLTITHSFISPTEVDVSGTYEIYAVMTIPSGTVTTTRVRRMVRHPFEVVS
jgi:hypothetical protein